VPISPKSRKEKVKTKKMAKRGQTVMTYFFTLLTALYALILLLTTTSLNYYQAYGSACVNNFTKKLIKILSSKIKQTKKLK
jgi:hypothetical protein